MKRNNYPGWASLFLMAGALCTCAPGLYAQNEQAPPPQQRQPQQCSVFVARELAEARLVGRHVQYGRGPGRAGRAENALEFRQRLLQVFGQAHEAAAVQILHGAR